MSYDIRNVKSITDFVNYFSQNLNWNIDIDDFDDIEDISYDFEASDIGLKEESFAKISSLRQLQPMVDGQQWGIFCVEFDSNKFEPSALKKILSGLVPRKRNSIDHAVWCQQDLLFICNWGTDNNRTVGVAHFEDKESGLPQIKMISCAPALEDFTQIKVFEDRLAQLRWPKNTGNIDEWREVWSSAFTTAYHQTIQDSSVLTIQLAAEAQNIRNRILDILEVETSNGYVHLLFEKFKNTLISDMTEQQFADMYAQTVVYGLFSARCMDATQDDFSAVEAVDCIPSTNPFLKSLMKDCLGHVNKGRLSFDELEIGNVVDLLKHTKTDVIIQDFNRQTGGGKEDPVIHFYEEFLTAYDKAQKVQRGVYYTPQPVVNFMVRAVDDILKKEFGYEDGLATTETKKIKILRKSQRKVNGYYTDVEEQIDVPAVQVLDPATGTGTFIRQIILQIYDNFCHKHQTESKDTIAEKWNKYVDESLLPRINAFELMMAPYAVAHMKLAMVLKDTGYDFSGLNRLNVFLTNTLEEAGNSDNQLTLFEDPLAAESIEANKVKKNIGVNVVIGNPPYSVSSTNRGAWIINLLSSYKKDLNEKKLNLDDDYIKFIRYGEYTVSNAGHGILAYISNSSFIDGVTHRQMRMELLREFDKVLILDLHGSVKKHEVAPDGSKDDNVFDIQQGVSINIFIKTSKSTSPAEVYYADVFGDRISKYNYLLSAELDEIKWQKLSPMQPYYFFAPKDFSTKDEYEQGILLTDLFDLNNSGIKTDRDSLFIDMNRSNQIEKTKTLLSGCLEQSFIEKYRVEDSSSYKLTEKIQGKTFKPECIRPIIYRPYDYQWIYYDPTIISRPGYQTMRHMLYPNYGLYVKRGFEDSSAPPAFCCDQLVCMRAWSRPGSIGSEYLFPLFQYHEYFGQLKKTVNFKKNAVVLFEEALGMKMTLEKSDNEDTFSALDLFDYIYGLLHSKDYITKYGEFLKIEFPRVKKPGDREEFWDLVRRGAKLREVHCMQYTEEDTIVQYCGAVPTTIEKVSWKDNKVYIGKENAFLNVDKELWDYYVGGYQPLQKWLKDRKNMTITSEDIEHYRRIVFAIKKTISLVDSNEIGSI